MTSRLSLPPSLKLKRTAFGAWTNVWITQNQIHVSERTYWEENVSYLVGDNWSVVSKMHGCQAPHSDIATIWGICVHTTYELQFDFNERSTFLFVPTPCAPYVEKEKHSIYSSVLKLPHLKGYYSVNVWSGLGKAAFLIPIGFPQRRIKNHNIKRTILVLSIAQCILLSRAVHR